MPRGRRRAGSELRKERGRTAFSRLIRPDLWAASVVDLDPLALRAQGLRGLILDLDNTLVGWNVPAPDQALAAWLERVRATGIAICVVSNNRAGRVAAFCRPLGVPGIPAARKPRRAGYRRALAVLGTQAAETAVVGDQVFTDVLGGRRMGLYTVLVRPVSRREFVGTRLVRVIEGLWLGHLRRRGYFAGG